ncbi:VOC family protein [Segeticoccus rhizosphaerae]|jgi:hypothetical protein|uniref:VOC family protein n=1 Tax=Segeticoccus rhizosphaerae TaxID=1104777 RepID=UPI0010C05721|nr:MULTISPECIES: VOC family protein [Intrasporangiaceae]
MRLENIVWDARDPHRLGTFWAAALDASPMTDEPEGFEARMSLGDDLFLDLCLQRVAEPSDSPARLHLDLRGDKDQEHHVQRLLGLGARRVDIGQGDVPWTVLVDPEGNAFCVMEQREAYRDTGPIAALPLDSADPDRDAAFWAELTGWQSYDGVAPASLRHPSGRGPVLEFCPEPEPKQGKNRLHLDVRAELGDEDLVSRALALGARSAEIGSDDLPWTVLNDPSGNEFCILEPSRSG